MMVKFWSGERKQRGDEMARTAEMGVRIAELREEKAMTQVELAKKAGISPSTLSLIESGKVERPQRVTIRRISEALGVEPQELRGKPPTQVISGAGDIPSAEAFGTAQVIQPRSLSAPEEFVRLLREVEALVNEFRDLQEGVESGQVQESFAFQRIAKDVESIERVLAS